MNSTVPVSVVVPCFRCASTIERAVASVAAQSSRPVEVILVDDCSKDRTTDVLESLVARYGSGWIKIRRLENNMGAASARNAGWAVASQRFVAFLDADDAWHPKKLEIQYDFMKANPEVALCGHGHRLLDQNILPDWEVSTPTARIVSRWRLLLSNQFVTPSVMVQRGVSSRFVEDQRHMEDHMLWLQISFSGAGVVKLDTELAAIYKAPFGARGLSAQIGLMEQGELENYRRLLNSKFINRYQFVGVCGYSLLKYLRRLAIYSGYLRWKKNSHG
jgi:glycosyltransferase involved in cell wall biosynthesis